jgi:hypothetical protein
MTEEVDAAIAFHMYEWLNDFAFEVEWIWRCGREVPLNGIDPDVCWPVGHGLRLSSGFTSFADTLVS